MSRKRAYFGTEVGYVQGGLADPVEKTGRVWCLPSTEVVMKCLSPLSQTVLALPDKVRSAVR